MNITMSRIQEQGHFPPAIREAMRAAGQKAVRMNATEVTPEHLFLGVLAQNDDGVAETFRALRLDQRMLREQAAILFPLDEGAGDEKDLLFSQEVQACLEWAASFAAHLQASQMQLEHVLLGSVRHHRLQPLLALFLLNAGSVLPSYMIDRSDVGYTATMDQLIAARVRRRNMVDTDTSNRMLSSIERPALTFSDIAGFHKVKHELQSMIDFLKQPQLVQQDRRSYLYGLFLVGPASNNRTLIGKATAGEATVPLFSLSIRALLETSHDAESYEKQTSGHDDAQRGRHIIHNLFEQGKKVSPCLLWLDEVDLLARPEARALGEQWQSQLRIEMDGYDTRPAMAVIATISRAEQVDQLQLSSCFDHIATMDGTVMKRFEPGPGACASCRQEIPAHWKYCGFCGAAVGKVCATCGTLSPDVKGVAYCPECGSSL